MVSGAFVAAGVGDGVGVAGLGIGAATGSGAIGLIGAGAGPGAGGFGNDCEGAETGGLGNAGDGIGADGLGTGTDCFSAGFGAGGTTVCVGEATGDGAEAGGFWAGTEPAGGVFASSFPASMPGVKTSGIFSPMEIFFCGRVGQCCEMNSGATILRGSSSEISALEDPPWGLGCSQAPMSFHWKIIFPDFKAASSSFIGRFTVEPAKSPFLISSKIASGHLSHKDAKGTGNTSPEGAGSLWGNCWPAETALAGAGEGVGAAGAAAGGGAGILMGAGAFAARGGGAFGAAVTEGMLAGTDGVWVA